MERVAYILGAGFSAPLGLPVMSNFLVKSKDLYSQKDQELVHFRDVFDTISDLSVIKNYFDSDLFNIEEILSILEMQENLEGETLSSDFEKYIKDVIRSYTPPIKKRESWPGNWQDFIFGSDNSWKPYGFFVSSLFGLRFDQIVDQESNTRTPRFQFLPNRQNQYFVITLNYDRVLESLTTFLSRELLHDEDLEFIMGPVRALHINETQKSLPLAKFHGSIDTKIIPPTWSKMLSEPILNAWKLAFEAISMANHIRIVGYSLPTADAYVKYLLKAGILASDHLKKIDVICLDRSGDVKARYDSFIDFNYYRFVNADFCDYMDLIAEQSNPRGLGRRKVLECDKLEEVHEKFMSALNESGT